MRAWLPLLGVVIAGCVTPVGISDVADLTGTWRGRIAGPRGNAAAQIVVDSQGRYTGTMYLDGDDRRFQGRFIVVRSGEVRYEGSEGSGAARLYRSTGGGAMLKLRGDEDGANAVFAQP